MRIWGERGLFRGEKNYSIESRHQASKRIIGFEGGSYLFFFFFFFSPWCLGKWGRRSKVIQPLSLLG